MKNWGVEIIKNWWGNGNILIFWPKATVNAVDGYGLPTDPRLYPPGLVVIWGKRRSRAFKWWFKLVSTTSGGRDN